MTNATVVSKPLSTASRGFGRIFRELLSQLPISIFLRALNRPR